MPTMQDWFFRIFSYFRGQQVGIDQVGNRYFQKRKTFGKKNHDRRWVIYKGFEEASKIPAEWHGWLHHRTDQLPDLQQPFHNWQKPHLPNLTGTSLAYRYQNQNILYPTLTHSSKDYEPWRP